MSTAEHGQPETVSPELASAGMQLSSIAAEIWAKLMPHLGSPNYTGCVVRLELLAEPTGIITNLVGNVGPHADRLSELAAEKISRLRREHAARGHVTSGQSRDPYRTMLGGAIVAKMLIISVAGLTEQGNEALAITLAKAFGILNRSEADVIAAINQNQLYLAVSTDLEL